MSDKQDPKRSLISKAFKEDGITLKTKSTLLDKGEVHVQTLEKQQQLRFSRQSSILFKKANKLSSLTKAKIFIIIYYKGKHFVYISNKSLS